MERQARIKLFVLDNIVWFISAGLYLFFVALRPEGFLKLQNIEFIVYTSSMIGLLVFGEAFALITGNLDISLAQNAGLSAMIVGFLLGVAMPGIPGWVGIILVIVVGALLGSINGLLIGKLGYNAFLATLVTYLVFDWSTYAIRRGAIVNLPDSYLAAGSMKIGGIHISIIIFLVIAYLLYLLLNKTRFGNWIYASGDNEKTTRMMGVNVGRVFLIVFTLTGALAGLSGLLYTGYIGSVTSLVAQGKIFNAFAGAIIGGVSLKGGKGSIIGALGGIIMLGILDAGLTMFNVDPSVRGILMGVVLGVAIYINITVENLRDKILMPH
ncbi:MAG: ABC transporter permease [Spirochaetales bacterium]|nr:ABC transporter permease [Spirochaetales bacterium]